jgi:UPF0716 family protein affecting phage T7 exclusion
MSQSLRAEWDRFRADPPGERFCNHYDRARSTPTSVRVIQLVVGLVLVAAGIVLCFIPGPGLLVMVFGLALLAGQSRTTARTLDRIEPSVRRFVRRIKQR